MKKIQFSLALLLFFGIFISGCFEDNGNTLKKDEEYTKPEDVLLNFNFTNYFVTHSSKILEIVGEPEGSNITWWFDKEIIGYGNKIEFRPQISEYKPLLAEVRWGPYQKNITRYIMIHKNDDVGGTQGFFGGPPNSENEFGGDGIIIEQSMMVPTLTFSFSTSEINGTFRFWIKLRKENMTEYFETILEIEKELNNRIYTKSFYYDKTFFIKRSQYEPYLMFFLFQVQNKDGSYCTIVTNHWLDY